ncbi:MAG: DUF1829 domain-containing protein [Methanotrichaceae archaeon]|nr:DUF1829 domain-containing protein [Methanotrichaceae archaeon]
MDEIESLMGQYMEWLKRKTTLRQVEGWVEITTPYLDRHNDYLQIYARKKNGSYILTDDGYIINDLHMSGCKLDSPKRKALLQMTLNGFGVKLVGDSLEVKAGQEDFPYRKHNLLQAMLALNDLFYLASPMVSSLFYEDVIAWLDDNEVRYIERVKFTGKSGYDHLFDFVIPRSKAEPERIIQAINRPSRDEAEIAAFSWLDTKDVRPPESRAYALLNDSEREVPAPVLDALHSYEVTPVPWSRRESIVRELTA